MYWDALLLTGGAGVVAGIARWFIISRICMLMIPVILVAGIMTSLSLTTENVVRWHYDGPVFSKLAETGKITVRFRNTSNHKIAVKSIMLAIHFKGGNTNDRTYFTDVDDGNDDSFVIGPKQTVYFTIPYHFSPFDRLSTLHADSEVDEVMFSQSNGCYAGPGLKCDHNPTFIEQ